MTPEQQHIAIAKVCGLPVKDVPNYTEDLNAMHEAEKTLDEPDSYEEQLIEVCGGRSYMWHASAKQRAEAFLRSLGQWTDTQSEEIK